MSPKPNQPPLASLRRRWLDPETAALLFADAEPFLAGRLLGHTLDLRGAEVGFDGPLGTFNLVSRDYCDFDMSHGKGAVIIRHARVERMIADRFTFDRATSLRRAVIASSRFVGAHFRLSAEDVEFLDCDFGGSTFAGGFNEYGFRRCKFVRCSFSGALWRNTYMRACQFRDCDFGDGRIVNSVLVGIRVFGVPFPAAFLAECEVKAISFDDTTVP